MDYQDILVKQYVAYIESKDRFVERSFFVNRFYLVLNILVAAFLCVAFEYTKAVASPIVSVFSFIGAVVSFLWLLNQDSYLYLIKVKLADVIEKFESHLPFQPHVLEYEGIKERGKKMRILFPEVQKGVAFVAFLAYFAIFVQHTGILAVNYLKDLF